MRQQSRQRRWALMICVCLVTFGLTETVADAAGEHDGHGGTAAAGQTVTGDDPGPCQQSVTPNKRGASNIVFEHGSCGGANWVPDVKAADAESQDIAFKTWQNVMEFCISHPNLGALKADGYSPVGDGGHWVNGGNDSKLDGTTTEGFIEFMKNPDTAVIDKAGMNDDSTPVLGIMSIEGWGLPKIGTLMRPHGSHGNAGDDPDTEMLHPWCMPTLEGAFQSELPQDETPGPEVLKQALQASKTGGIAAISVGVDGDFTSAGQSAATNATGTATGTGTGLASQGTPTGSTQPTRKPTTGSTTAGTQGSKTTQTSRTSGGSPVRSYAPQVKAPWAQGRTAGIGTSS